MNTSNKNLFFDERLLTVLLLFFSISVALGFVHYFTDGLFEIFPSCIFPFLYIVVRNKLITASKLILIALSLIILYFVFRGDYILTRVFYNIFTILTYIIFSQYLSFQRVLRCFSIIILLSLFGVTASRFSPEFQNIVYEITRPGETAESLQSYSNAVAGFASEPAYVSGMIVSMLSALLYIRGFKVQRFSNSVAILILLCLLTLIISGSLTGYLGAILLMPMFSLWTNFLFLITIFILLVTFSTNPVVNRIYSVIDLIYYQPETFLFTTDVTARNSIFIEFYTRPFDLGSLFTGETLARSGSMLVESLHLLISPFDYIILPLGFYLLFKNHKLTFKLFYYILFNCIFLTPISLAVGLIAARSFPSFSPTLPSNKNPNDIKSS